MHSIRSDVEPVDPSLVPLYISEIDISLYTQVAILTLLVYNAVITMDKEIKYFWNTPRSFVSLIYFAVSNTLHSHTNYLTDILLIRVLALYHQTTDKRLAACLRTLFGLEAAFGLGILIYGKIYQKSKSIVLELAEGIRFCGWNRNPPKMWGALSWAAPMVYGIILMALALYKGAEFWRETSGFSQFTLVKVLVQDQAIYFIIVIFCSVMEIVSDQLEVPNAVLANLLSVLGSPSLLCILGSHLLVHLKEAGERGGNGGTSYRMRTMSIIEFS
ncbi:hypothetical protein DFH11DRAFT_1511888 [Phellopilus nigrolimitatus]|nr:hypothetical protein DFH11DRAFT_1511888 [Phellopilus nigrolimitatus]